MEQPAGKSVRPDNKAERREKGERAERQEKKEKIERDDNKVERHEKVERSEHKERSVKPSRADTERSARSSRSHHHRSHHSKREKKDKKEKKEKKEHKALSFHHIKVSKLKVSSLNVDGLDIDPREARERVIVRNKTCENPKGDGTVPVINRDRMDSTFDASTPGPTILVPISTINSRKERIPLTEVKTSFTYTNTAQCPVVVEMVVFPITITGKKIGGVINLNVSPPVVIPFGAQMHKLLPAALSYQSQTLSPGSQANFATDSVLSGDEAEYLFHISDVHAPNGYLAWNAPGIPFAGAIYMAIATCLSHPAGNVVNEKCSDPVVTMVYQ
jgi:hypothetical protein